MIGPASLALLMGCGEKRIEISGIVRVKEYELGSRVGGTVERILVEEGQSVQAGAVLIELDDSKIVAQRRVLEQSLAQAEAQYARLVEGATPEEIARARAELAGAEAQYAKTLSGFRSEDISSAREAVNAIQAKFDLLTKEAERATKLFNEGVVSESHYEKAIAERDSAGAQLEAARDNLEKLTTGYQLEDIVTAQSAVEARKAVLLQLKKGPTKNDLAFAEANVKRVRAEIARIELDIADTLVTAPVTGVVETIDLEVGEITQPGVPFLTLISTQDPWIEAYVPESLLGTIREGTSVRVVADTDRDLPFDAEIIFVSREAEYTPRNIFTPEQRINQIYRIKLKPIAPRVLLRGGVNVTVFIDTK